MGRAAAVVVVAVVVDAAVVESESGAVALVVVGCDGIAAVADGGNGGGAVVRGGLQADSRLGCHEDPQRRYKADGLPTATCIRVHTAARTVCTPAGVPGSHAH